MDFLKALEEEDVTPSIWPLLKVALALGQRLGTFMDDGVDGDVCITRRAERGGDATTFGNGRGNSASFVYHSLGSATTDRHMEPFSIEIRPDEKTHTEKTPPPHEGEEFVAVIAGELKVLLGPERHVFGPGDTICYNSVVPHYVGGGNALPTPRSTPCCTYRSKKEETVMSFVQASPLTTSGKVQKFKLRELAAKRFPEVMR